MSLSLPEALGSIAAAQALAVAPALGESYAGKSAGALALLLMMLADGADARAGRRLALAARADALLQARGVPSAGPDGEGPDARMDRLLGLLGTLLARAEATDPQTARQVRDWLADWAENERLLLPPVAAADA
jgi:hypothetical protein